MRLAALRSLGARRGLRARCDGPWRCGWTGPACASSPAETTQAGHTGELRTTRYSAYRGRVGAWQFAFQAPPPPAPIHNSSDKLSERLINQKQPLGNPMSGLSPHPRILTSCFLMSLAKGLSILFESKAPQLCLTLCDPMDCSPSGSSVHGILQARILEWLAVSFSGDLPDPGMAPGSPALRAHARAPREFSIFSGKPALRFIDPY